VEDFLLSDASLEKQSEPGTEHGAHLADDDFNRRRRNAESLKV
jgi:hypothetical protein